MQNIFVTCFCLVVAFSGSLLVAEYSGSTPAFAKPAPATQTKPAVKPASTAKPVAKPALKPAVKPVVKPAPKPVVKPKPLTEAEKVAAALEKFATARVNQLQNNVVPSSKKKEVVPVEGGFVARYIHINALQMELTVVPSKAPGSKFIGTMTYKEELFEAKGHSPADALSGKFVLVKVRNIKEIVRYTKGQWY